VLDLVGDSERRTVAEFEAELWTATLGRTLVALFLAV
jgi:hypothetical protein